MTMRASVATLALLAAPLGAQVPTPPDTGATPPAVAQRDTARVPAPDQARGVDAEIRIAAYELIHDRWIPALSRLEWLQQSPVALTDLRADAVFRGRQEMQFLLAQSYYRLGMSDRFRAVSQQLLGTAGDQRYATLLRSQLLLDSYRRGEYERARGLATELGTGEAAPGVRGLASLVSGLASYQTGNYAAARSGFAAAQQGGGAFAEYARYMDALAMLRMDTAQTAPALDALRTLAGQASGEFANQVRLTAAQLAYESDRFADAATLAGQVPTGSGLAPQATLTRAWALYGAEQLQQAGEAFSQFASRYPDLPEREEAQLMAAQVQLQLNRTAEAGRIFRAVADTAAQHSQRLRARATGATDQAARALVQARAAGLLFVTDPGSGKTLALDDAAGIDWPMILGAAPTGTAVPAPQITPPRIVSLEQVAARLDTAAARGGAAQQPTATPGAPMPVQQGMNGAQLPRRVYFTQTSGSTTRGQYASRAQALYEADVAVALARYRLDDAVAAHQRQIALLQGLRTLLDQDAASVEQMLARLNAAQDSLIRLNAILEAQAVRIRQMFVSQLNVTRVLANENQAMIDSVRQTMAGNLDEGESSALQMESETAASYRQLTEIIERGMDAAIANHPVLAYRDTVRQRGDVIARLIDETTRALADARSAIDSELARMRAEESGRVAALRGSLASAEAARQGIESQVVQLVRTELDARANEVLAALARGTEAAEFGAASASFFQALEAGGAAGEREQQAPAPRTEENATRAAPPVTPPSQQ